MPPRLTSHIHPGRVSPQSRLFTSHLHRVDVLAPSRFRKLHLISTQVPFETHPSLDINSIHALPHLHQRPKTSCLTYFHVPTNHIPRPTSPIHLGCISTQSRSFYLCLTSIYVTSQSLTSNLSAENCLQSLSRSLIIYTKVTWCSSCLHPSNSLDSYLIFIKVVSHHQCHKKWISIPS